MSPITDIDGNRLLSSHTLEFNQQHGTQYSNEELARRESEAEPYKISQLMGGASANTSLLGQHASVWHQVLRKARKDSGSDDPSIIDDYVRLQLERIMGLEDKNELIKLQPARTVANLPQHSTKE